ncbi:hypothetical protein SEUCBS139899_006026 [Sporothrix eucalyptigena]|uniref:NmrA-like domain-containing protein n=1 Tax=Sporothrix eucalyptigena TaxID=1812306 RepID=A0ABP0D0D5_9PEZI
MSSQKLVITVFGATGNQGGSVIAALLAAPALASKYAIRGVTRDPTKPSAQKLRDKGVEPIKADLSDPASLTSAVTGSTAVFAVTNYWDTMSKTTEETQGKNIVDACIAAKVQHLVWSSLPNATKMTNGKLPHIEHFDSKANVSAYAEQEKSKTGLWVTHFMAAYFMQNIRGSIKKDPATGISTWSLPWTETQTQLPLLNIVADTGKYVVGALTLGEAADGKFIQGVSQWLTPGEAAQTISETTGSKVVYKEIPVEEWRERLPMPDFVKIELGENLLLIRDYNYFGKDAPSKQGDSDVFVKAVPGQKLTTLAEFIRANWN